MPRGAANTVGELRAFLTGLPDRKPVASITLDEPLFIIAVDSEGRARKVLIKTTRTYLFAIETEVQ